MCFVFSPEVRISAASRARLRVRDETCLSLSCRNRRCRTEAERERCSVPVMRSRERCRTIATSQSQIRRAGGTQGFVSKVLRQFCDSFEIEIRIGGNDSSAARIGTTYSDCHHVSSAAHLDVFRCIADVGAL